MKNIELINNKGLDDNQYKDLEKKYKYLLEYYLSTIINFNEYEEEINNSNLYIGKNSKYKSINLYLNLYYIFLINNLFIEKLSMDDINLLSNFNGNVNNELIDLIKRTYKDIILDNYTKDGYIEDTYKVCYGDVVPFNFVDNDALVLKIYYGKNTRNIDGKEFIELHKKQLNFFNILIDKIINEIEEKLDVKCNVLLEKRYILK